MCKDVPVNPVNRVVGKKRIIGKNGGRRRRRGTRDRRPKKEDPGFESRQGVRFFGI
jgi:hypothetical protein